MDSCLLDLADRSSPETLSDSSLSPDSPETNGILGDPAMQPRVGDEYQVEIPALSSNSERVQLMMNAVDSEGIVDSSYSFSLGLPIQLMWLCNQATPVKLERLESPSVSHAIHTNGLAGSGKVATTQTSVGIEDPDVKINGRTQTYVGNRCLVPGQVSESWSDFEADCFLLGLYLFGKNLLQIKRFVESKGQGQVLSYYYGQFYGSPGYNRWSECRKVKSRKCVVGHRFFTGHRQQELISRLSAHLSDESKTKLMEAARAFAEGSTSLDEFIFTLKSLVGIHALVDAVGIGKGKGDLTTLVLDGSRNNQVNANRPELPSGKACSSLSCAEVVKYLTGGFRLSKARSNDLFWEAVWPRLLARGWHSELPMGDGYTGSKHCLVFLMPGINKFSRRKLSKGEHYFDCVSDVLAKVASEPGLLELEADGTNPSCFKEVNGWATEGKSDEDQEPSDQERHCYLKPRASLGLSDRTVFMVIDTSLANEDNPFKVRELRNLPAEVNELSRQLPNGLQNSSFYANSRGTSSEKESQRISAGKFVPSSKSADACMSMGHKSRTIKHKFSRRVKPGLASCSSQVKRRRFASCVDVDLTYVLALPAKNKNTTLKIVGPFKLRPGDVEVKPENSLAAAPVNAKIYGDGIKGDYVGIDISPDHEKLRPADVEVKPENSLAAAPVNEKIYGDGINGDHVGIDISPDHEKLRSADVEVEPENSLAAAPVNEMIYEGGINGDHVDIDISPDHENLSKPQMGIDLNIPQVPSESQSDIKVKVEEEVGISNQYSDTEKPEHFDADKHKHCDVHIPSRVVAEISVISKVENSKPFVGEILKISEFTAGPSDNIKPQVSSVVGMCPPKDRESDQQPRRQSTRNRPLTTKALEALEFGFLDPVRTYKKRSPSTTQNQKPKRSRQLHNNSSVFPEDMAFTDEGA